MKKRIERLEAKRSGSSWPTLIAFIPVEWGDDEQREEVTRLAEQGCFPEPHETMLIETAEATARLQYVEDFDALLKGVAASSRRIGMQ